MCVSYRTLLGIVHLRILPWYTVTMKLGLIIQSHTPERVWNTFRLGQTALSKGHSVRIFLISEGSELETIADTDHFDLSVKVREFKEQGGEILACGTCLKLRGKEGTETCPLSTMTDLLEIIETSDKVLVF